MHACMQPVFTKHVQVLVLGTATASFTLGNVCRHRAHHLSCLIPSTHLYSSLHSHAVMSLCCQCGNWGLGEVPKSIELARGRVKNSGWLHSQGSPQGMHSLPPEVSRCGHTSSSKTHRGFLFNTVAPPWYQSWPPHQTWHQVLKEM